MALAEIVQRIRSFTPSIGQMFFGSFLLLLGMMVMTSVASVLSIRHINVTFAELQHLQSLGDVVDEIDRRTNELRLAVREYVTDPDSSSQAWEAAASLSTLLKNTRLQLAPEQQEMIDGVTQRLANYRDGMERITALIGARAELVAALPPIRERFEKAIADIPDRATARALFRAQNQVNTALLAHDSVASERSARAMKSLSIDDTPLRAATDAYAEAIISISMAETQITQIDKEVLGTEGQMISRVTDLLRDLGERRGRVLAADFARTLDHDRWQSILIGLASLLIGVAAALFVVRTAVAPLN